MGSALLNTAASLEFASNQSDFVSPLNLPDGGHSQWERAAIVSSTARDLRAQVAERLAAHRSRRGATRAPAAAGPDRPAMAERSAQIAAAVAQRYARTPSYRELLAAEAERAIQQARAAAEVAAQNAQAIAAAQQRLLQAYDHNESREAADQRELPKAGDPPAIAQEHPQLDHAAESIEQGNAYAAGEQHLWLDLALLDEVATRVETARTNKLAARAAVRTATKQALKSPGIASSAAAIPLPGLTVRLYEDDADRGSVASTRAVPIAARSGLREQRGYGQPRGYGEDRSAAEARALDEEIAFRHAPVFEEPAGPPVALAANLIEFPRQLVAARKARPRYAEGPLRDEREPAPGDSQLRIFEVDPAQISTSAADAEAQTAQWTSLWLDAPAGSAAAMDDVEQDALTQRLARPVPALQPASIARRSAAGAINLGIVFCGLAASAGIFMTIAAHGIPAHAVAAQPNDSTLAQAGLQTRTIAAIAAVSAAFMLAMYHALFFWFSTATPGMRLVRIALCTFDDGNPSRTGVRRRMAAAMLSSCSLGMGYAWALLDEERLTWHDRISRMYLRKY